MIHQPGDGAKRIRANGSERRVPFLDLLRFAAAGFVVFYHLTYRPAYTGEVDVVAFGWLQAVSKFGYLGVDLFFIISGFVILWSASGRTAPEFAISRFSRLYPSYWASLVITTLVLLALQPTRALLDPVALIANLTMVPGRLGQPLVDGVYWTLAIELKFYLIVTLLVAIRQVQNAFSWLVAWLSMTAIAFMISDLRFVKSVAMFPYGAFFAGGCIAYLVWRDGLRLSYLAAYLVAACLGCCAGWRQISDFVTEPTTADRWVAVGLIASSYWAVLGVATRRVCEIDPRTALIAGAYTYPIYLLHNEIGKAIQHVSYTSVGHWGGLLVALSGVAILSWLVTELFELRAAPALRRFMTAVCSEANRTRGKP